MIKRKRQHADEVLKRFRKRRDSPACYPCSRRKVRCTGGRPCGTCVARGHADICYEADERRIESLPTPNNSSSTSHASPGVATNTAETIRQQHNSTSDIPPARSHLTPASASPVEPRVGRFSAVNFIRDRLRGSSNKVPTGELHPTVGLGNADGQLPTLAPLGAACMNNVLPPKREEVLRYYPPFKDCVIPLYPVIPDKALFESLIHKILADSSAELEDAQKAMILAAFALGAQFEEFAPKPRVPTSLDLISRSNVYLQRANYIFQPTLEAVQALLMIGMALQNAGRPDGAWNLLGLNYRLAQTLGLHLLDPDDEAAGPGATIWLAIIWQDCLLSCRYDRKPLADLTSTINSTPKSDLTYYHALRNLCALDMGLLAQPHSRRSDVNYVHSLVRDVDNLLSRCCAHLSQARPPGEPWTFQQRLQHGALKLHSAQFLADICRPMFSISAANDDEQGTNQLRQRGFDALKASIEAFLEIWTFSNIPLRQWSMAQATVSCAIVLALIIQDTRTKSSSTTAIIALLRKLAHVLKTGTSSQNSEAIKPISVDDLQGVCLMRIKGAGLLEAILDSHADNSSKLPAGDGCVEQESHVGNVAPLEIDRLSSAEDFVWPARLPVFDRAFLADSVLDFDVDQNWFEENVPASFG